MTDAGFWGVAWAILAAAAGLGLAVAAISRLRRAEAADEFEFAVGYNAMAPVLRRPA